MSASDSKTQTCVYVYILLQMDKHPLKRIIDKLDTSIADFYLVNTCKIAFVLSAV